MLKVFFYVFIVHSASFISVDMQKAVCWVNITNFALLFSRHVIPTPKRRCRDIANCLLCLLDENDEFSFLFVSACEDEASSLSPSQVERCFMCTRRNEDGGTRWSGARAEVTGNKRERLLKIWMTSLASIGNYFLEHKSWQYQLFKRYHRVDAYWLAIVERWSDIKAFE